MSELAARENFTPLSGYQDLASMFVDAGHFSKKDFRVRATYGLAALTVLVLLPFVVNHFIHGRLLMATSTVFIMGVMLINAREIWHGRHCPDLILLVLLPSVIAILVLTHQSQGIFGALWTFPAILAFYCLLTARHAILANVLILTVMIPTTLSMLEFSLAIRVVATLLTVSGFTAIFAHNLANQQALLEKQVCTDPLTGLLNRSSLSRTLLKSVEQNKQNGKPTTILMLDIDHFKSVNDEYGHDAGDRVIRKVGNLIARNVREHDLAFRIGGEEFLVLLRDTDHVQSEDIAQQIRQSVEKSTMIRGRPVTVSIGMASLDSSEDHDQWFKRADTRLYEAKTKGRNCVSG